MQVNINSIHCDRILHDDTMQWKKLEKLDMEKTKQGVRSK